MRKGLLVAAVIGIMSSNASWADPVPVLNHSFESPDISPDEQRYVRPDHWAWNGLSDRQYIDRVTGVTDGLQSVGLHGWVSYGWALSQDVKRADGITAWTVRAGEIYTLTLDTDYGYGSLVLARGSETYELAVTNGSNAYTVMGTVQTAPATIDALHDGWKLRVRAGSQSWGYVDNVRVEYEPTPWVRLPLQNPSFELPDISPDGYQAVTPTYWNFGGGMRDRLAILSTNDPPNAQYITDGKQCIVLATYQDWHDVKQADGVSDWSVRAGEIYTLMYDSISSSGSLVLYQGAETYTLAATNGIGGMNTVATSPMAIDRPHSGWNLRITLGHDWMVWNYVDNVRVDYLPVPATGMLIHLR